jgi:hypothetical protein
MTCPHGCRVSPDRLREHLFYVHGPAPCACGCGEPVPSIKATFASKSCLEANRAAWEDARNALSEYKAVLRIQ